MVRAVNPTGLRLAQANILVGGDFSINPWQRNTTFTSAANGFTADRFYWYNAAGTGVVDVKKTADGPTIAEAGIASAHCYHVDVTTADAVMAAGDAYEIDYNVEGYDIQQAGFGSTGAKNVTLSFWHKHTKTGTYCVYFRNAGVTRSYVVEYSQDVSDTWEFTSITVPGDTAGTWLTGSSNGLHFGFMLAAGTNNQNTANTWHGSNATHTSNQVNALDSASNNFKLSLVKLEIGDVATPYPVETFEQVLARAQRYFCKTFTTSVAPAAGVNGPLVMPKEVANTPTTSGMTFQYPVEMRAAPTLTYYTTRAGGTANSWSNGASEIVGAATYITTRGVMLYSTSATISVARYYANMTAEAEL